MEVHIPLSECLFKLVVVGDRSVSKSVILIRLMQEETMDAESIEMGMTDNLHLYDRIGIGYGPVDPLQSDNSKRKTKYPPRKQSPQPTHQKRMKQSRNYH